MNEEEAQSRPGGGGDGEGAPTGGGAGAQRAAEEAPSEEELRKRLEEELRRLRVQDVLLQSVVSLINLSSRRIGKEDERDLEQARVGIEAVRALVDLLDREPAQQVRNALSELQMEYAKQAGEGPAEASQPGEAPAEQAAPSEGERAAPRQGAEGAPRKPPPGLWTPPGSK
jgi:hypothetical protein